MNITPEQIRALNAGAEADHLAAEYIFEWKWFYRPATPDEHIAIRMLVPSDVEPPPHLKPWTPADGECGIVEIVRPADFSSDWDAMKQIVIQMRAKGWEWAIFSIKAGLFVVKFCKGEISSEAVAFSTQAKATAITSPLSLRHCAESGAPLAVVKAALLALCAEQEAGNG